MSRVEGSFSKADRDRLGEVVISNLFNISINMAVQHMNNASGVGGEGGVMSDHNNGIALSVNVTEFFHHNMRRAGIEIAGGFVGEDDFWFSHDGARNGYALLLTARELAGHVVFAFLKVEAPESGGGLLETVEFRVASIN